MHSNDNRRVKARHGQAQTLNFKKERLVVQCDICGRRGEYNLARLIEVTARISFSLICGPVFAASCISDASRMVRISARWVTLTYPASS